MAQTTITEALAELKTIGKRIESKQRYLLGYIGRFEGQKDPLEKDGGSAEMIRRERQAIQDLQERTIRIRRAISLANEANSIIVEGQTRTIADWLTWRRDVAPQMKQLLDAITNGVNQARNAAKKEGSRVVDTTGTAQEPKDIVVNVSESQLAGDIEWLVTVLGNLDGQLSLKNATITIEV